MKNGCWSDQPRYRVEHILVRHGNGNEGNESWEHRMSRKCRYDRKAQDEQCTECKVYYDDDYVRSLKK